MFLNLVLVAGGGAAGAVMRYGLTSLADTVSKSSFPFGTFTVNIIGCFLAGCLSSLIDRYMIDSSARMFLLIGFIGSFTTFSTYMLESYKLIQEKAYFHAFLNISVSTVVGFFFVLCGLLFTRRLLPEIA
jgi:CrcB protein